MCWTSKIDHLVIMLSTGTRCNMTSWICKYFLTLLTDAKTYTRGPEKIFSLDLDNALFHQPWFLHDPTMAGLLQHTQPNYGFISFVKQAADFKKKINGIFRKFSFIIHKNIMYYHQLFINVLLNFQSLKIIRNQCLLF